MTKKTYGSAGHGIRKMMRPYVLAGLVICLGLFGLAGWLVVTGRWFTAGPLGIALFVVAVVASKALQFIEKRSGQMQRGLDAEEAVEKVLETLGDCCVVHDIVIRRGNIDHVVVTPAGIYTIETKSHKGKVTFDGQQLLLNGRKLEKDFLAQSYAEAMALRDYLKKVSGGQEHYVMPLLVFTRGFVQVKGPAKGVKVLPMKWLVGELTRGRPRLSEEKRAAISRSLEHLTSVALERTRA